MADRLAIASGNWSATSTWTGGIIPGTGDVACANGFTVTIDQDISVDRLSNGTWGGATVDGGFVIASTGGGTRTITLTELANPTTTYSESGGTVLLTISATSGTVDFGSADIRGYNNKDNMYCLRVTGEGVTVMTTGLVIGGANGWSNRGVELAAECTFECGGIRGPISGTTGWGMVLSAGSSQVTVNGDVVSTQQGGAIISQVNGSLYHPVFQINGNLYAEQSPPGTTVFNSEWRPFTMVVTGNVYSSTSGYAIFTGDHRAVIDIKGVVTASTSYPAVHASESLNIRVRTLVDASNGRKAVFARGWVMPEGELVTQTIMDDQLVAPFTPGSQVILSNYVAGSPAPSDVREGVTYGPTGALTGTAAVPEPQQVAYGIAVDDTIGTAALTVTGVATVVGAQLASVVGV